ncbi:MAG: nitrilase-related carbon-nitrogen hydrolase [Bacillota bacterium]
MYDMLGKYYSCRLRPNKLKKKLKTGYRMPDVTKSIKLPRVACVQRMIKPVRSIDGYIDMVDCFARKAYESGCDLLVFPEYNFFDLLGLIPCFSLIDRLLSRPSKEKAAMVKADDEGAGLYPVFLSIAVPVQNAIESIMCSIARVYGIYIYTGTYPVKKGNALYNSGSLVSREGEILGRQHKIHLTEHEDRIGFGRTDVLNSFDTDFGKIAIPVCMDATYFEIFKKAYDSGCDIVVLPIANSEEYNVYRAIRGIWSRVQENYVFGLKSALTGSVAGIHFTGKAGVFAPMEMTERKNGIVAVSKHWEGNELVIADLDIASLVKLRQEAEYFGDRNELFEREYNKRTYVRG